MDSITFGKAFEGMKIVELVSIFLLARNFSLIERYLVQESHDIAWQYPLPKLLHYDPEDFKTVFQSQGQYPIRRGFDTIVDYRSNVRKNFYQGVIGFVDQGKSWWDFRHKVNSVMMKPQITRKYVPAVDEVTQDFVKRLHSLRDQNMETPADFYAELNMWALESIGQITLDTRLGIFDNTTSKNMHSLMSDLKVFFDLTYQLNFKPSLWKLFPTPSYRKLIRSTDNMYSVIQEYINIGIQKMKENTDDAENEGVLKKLLEIDPKIATIMVMDSLFAGVDSNPEKQDKLREELIRILPNKTSPLTVENMTNMPYLRACIKEGLRINSVLFANFQDTSIRCNSSLPGDSPEIQSPFLQIDDQGTFVHLEK
uniref:Uncharacterized protein n=1 Tax=Phlebotomus papatasi TaxID=29031 RepID=A0A1B0DMP2_PHLPP